MRRAAVKRARIPVESRSRLDRLHSAGERLLEHDPGRLDRVIAMAEAYLSIYEGRTSDLRMHLIQVQGNGPKDVN